MALGSFALFATAFLSINFLFLEQSVRFAADKVEAKTGFEIQYDSVEGNLFSGGFAFTGLSLKQTQPSEPQLTVEAQDIDANLSVWNFIFGNRVIDSATVSKAQIVLQTLPKDKAPKKGFNFAIAWGEKGLDALDLTKAPLLQSPLFIVKDLKLEEVSIHVDDYATQTPISYDLQIARLQAQPLRSHFALLDLLFRSNLEGTLNDSRLEIVNTESDGQRYTKWATSDFPAATLASLVGGPFHLFEASTVDVEVTDQWESVETLDLNWKIKVTDGQARLPEGAPELLKPLVQVWVDNINKNEEDWEFGFQLQFSESQFKGASSLSAQQIWTDSIPIFLKQVAEHTGLEESIVKEKASKAIDAVKGFLENRTKKE